MAEIKFVIIANPRTGTNHFIDLLNSHVDVTCHSEVFHQNTVYLLEGDRDDLLEERERNPIEFLKGLYDSSPTKACGFKIFKGHNANIVNHVLLDRTIKKIFLYRQNFLAVYSSERIAEAEKRYLVWEQSEQRIDADAYVSSITSKKAIFNQDHFFYELDAYQNFYKNALETIIESGQEFVFMTYEEFVNEFVFRQIFPFLGVAQPSKMASRMRKLNSNNILSRFSNPDEAKACIEAIGRQNWACEGFMLWDRKS